MRKGQQTKHIDFQVTQALDDFQQTCISDCQHAVSGQGPDPAISQASAWFKFIYSSDDLFLLA